MRITLKGGEIKGDQSVQQRLIKQGNLTPDDQPIDETDEAIEIIDVSEYKPRRIPSKQ